jgi:hypothetical protein
MKSSRNLKHIINKIRRHELRGGEKYPLQIPKRAMKSSRNLKHIINKIRKHELRGGEK